MERVLIPGGGEVLVGRNLVAIDPLLPPREGRRRVAVLTQPGAAAIADRVARRIGESGPRCEVRVLPDAEAAKTLAVAGEVYEWLAEQRLGRHDTVVGVGGGAVTDLAGFVAATWLRGVEVVHVPTTLLAAVDAAIGGKTGVNLAGKNLVGAFWHPTRVVVDLEVLAELPASLYREGLAEIAKVGLVGDPDLVALLERQGPEAPLEALVPAAVAVKAAVVGEDFREAGRRAVLNYGHTIGHAVEVAGGMRHGDAVAVGMVAAGAAATHQVGFGDATRQERLLAGLGLPVRVAGLARPQVEKLLELDKKRDEVGLRMVLLEAIGHPVVHHVGTDVVAAALDAIGVR